MTRTAWTAVALTVVLALILLILLANGAAGLPDMDMKTRVEYLKLYVDLAQAVLVGFGAALLGVLIPAVFSETKSNFERLRDSRIAYSEAKTGCDYLQVRLATMDLKAASAHVQNVHVKKHEAELYGELARHLRRRGIKETQEQWGDGLYLELFATREVLEKHADEWDRKLPSQRLALLHAAVPPKEPQNVVKGTTVPPALAGRVVGA